MEQNRISVKLVIKEAVRIFKDQWKFFLILGVGFFVSRLLFEVVSQMLQDSALLAFVWGLTRSAIEMYFGLALIVIALRAVDNEELSWRGIVSLLPTDVELIKKYVITSIVYGLIVFGGLLLLLVPGIIWGIMYSLALYAAIERRVGVKEALSISKQLTAGNKIKIVTLSTVLILINLAGMLVFGLGIVVTMPISTLAGAVMYRMLSGEYHPQATPSKPVARPPVKDQSVVESQPVSGNIAHSLPVSKQASSMNDYQL